VRAVHFAIPSPKYFARFSSIIFEWRFKFKEVRVAQYANASSKYFGML